MNTQTQEALKMAIKALMVGSKIADTFLPSDDRTIQISKAINACKEALEQPLLITRIACPESNIKQPEQEPVAYEKVEAWLIPRILDIHGARKTSLPKEAHDEFHGSVVWGAEVWCDLGYYVEDKNGVRHYAKPLYTHPAQLKRLSDEEINQMFDVGEAEISKLDKELARAIEKVIVTKNGMELRDE